MNYAIKLIMEKTKAYSLIFIILIQGENKLFLILQNWKHDAADPNVMK